MTEVATRPAEEAANLPTSYEPRNLAELEDFCRKVCGTELVPKAYKGKPLDAMVAMMFGKETADLGPLTSLQFIAVINGKPGYYSDAVPGIAMKKKLVVDMEEFFEGKPYEDDFKAVCLVTRPSGRVVRSEFSVADAKRAGLFGNKDGPWKQYTKRMLMWRARGYGIRDAAPHMLFGSTVEELRDMQGQEHVGPDRAKDVTPAARRAPEERVALADRYGEEFMLEPGAVPGWIAEQVREATDPELQELLGANEDREDVRDAVMAEAERRAAAQRAADPDPLKILGKPPAEAVQALKGAVEQAETKAEATSLFWKYKDALSKNGAKKAMDAIEGWLLSWKEPGEGEDDQPGLV